MATTSIISDGTTEANSSDFSLAAGESATLSLRGAGGGARVVIQFKASDATYQDFGYLDSQTPVVVLSAIGTFRCVKRASSAAFGVDKS